MLQQHKRSPKIIINKSIIKPPTHYYSILLTKEKSYSILNNIQQKRGSMKEGIKMSTLELEALSDEELIGQYREGQLEAVEVLVQRYKPFVRKKIRSNYYIGADKEDLLQEGMIGLFKAICDYNPDREAAFKSFATICVTRQLSTAFKTATRQKHLALNTSISLSSKVGQNDDENITLMDLLEGNQDSNPENLMIHQEALESLQSNIKESLSDLEWEVLMLHSQGRNYHEISKNTGKSIKSIDNALQRIKRKLMDKRGLLV